MPSYSTMNALLAQTRPYSLGQTRHNKPRGIELIPYVVGWAIGALAGILAITPVAAIRNLWEGTK